ncbi:MAG: histidine phosphotransferase family protein [Parasphingopyxis sp.]|nr:histidine phosphotransferase [Sphingomonadales bacterium]
MDEKSVEFASLLASRLCHDLLSPIGALNNGIELLADEQDPEMRQRCLELLGESASASAAKLKFFRLAFGAAGGFEDQIDTREARSAIDGLLGTHGRVALDWLVADPVMSKPRMKVLLNLALIAADALVRGGKLTVGVETDEIVVRAEGERLVLDPELKTALLGKTGAEALTPRAAAAWLVHVLVRQGGGEVQISEPEENILVFGASF